ncbi:MAG: phenylalanine--tRNA ligase subunit alpha [Chlamydiales bacterium]|nr:phenylalanine--tRNA ligase subunit alpha [Chlamydiales bacterium]
MQENIAAIRQAFQDELQTATTTAAVEAIQVKFLGRKGPIQALMKELRDVPSDQRPQVGKDINDLRDYLQQASEQAMSSLRGQETNKQLQEEVLDITLPGKRGFQGCKHVVHSVMDEIIDALVSMGFSIQDGPEIETDYYNFEALNFPPDHPARDMQDTFYVAPDVVLRTHTSNIQVRVMESTKPPIRIIAPGRCYRNEAVSARHHVFFHQVEAVYIDKGVTFSHLLSTLEDFLQKVFGHDVVVRFRPSFFPFVEPGMEVDIRCSLCQGQGCSMCKHSGWLEVLGAGMVHPDVLKNGGIDPEEYSGFAWGLGVERIANLKYHINDIRLFSENDIRFLQQFQAI